MDRQSTTAIKVSVTLKQSKKSEICSIHSRYYGIISAGKTRYSIGSEACALLAALSQPVIGVDRSSDSEVFRVTRGIGQGCSTRFVAFPVASQISRFRSQNYFGKTTRSRRWCRCRSWSRGSARCCRWYRGRRRCCRWSKCCGYRRRGRKGSGRCCRRGCRRCRSWRWARSRRRRRIDSSSCLYGHNLAI